jgi:3-hydroxyisobutyrate dehydrogenase-like beta-hydroxyacid dehydrogenase
VFAGTGGFLEGIQPGTIALQMSTVSLGHVEQLAELLSARGCALIDVPVSGSVAMAEQGTLTLMAGGAASDLDAVRPVLEAIGSRVFHLGPQGSGAAMKLAVNTVVYGLNEALAEGLVLAERAGIDRLQAYEVFAESAVAAPFVHYRRLAFERPDETPVAFRLELAAKDLGLIKDFADALGQSLPQAELNAEVLAAAIEDGFADYDVSLVAEYLRRDGERDLRIAEEPA